MSCIRLVPCPIPSPGRSNPDPLPTSQAPAIDQSFGADASPNVQELQHAACSAAGTSTHLFLVPSRDRIANMRQEADQSGAL